MSGPVAFFWPLVETGLLPGDTAGRAALPGSSWGKRAACGWQGLALYCCRGSCPLAALATAELRVSFLLATASQRVCITRKNLQLRGLVACRAWLCRVPMCL